MEEYKANSLKLTGGIALFAIASLWLADFSFTSVSVGTTDTSPGAFLASLVLAILAYKGFTTITNSGAEIVDPHRNVSRTIIISISISAIFYKLDLSPGHIFHTKYI